MALDEQLIQQVWEKARVMAGHDPTEWRQDQCGAWLLREAYDQGHSAYGWKVVNTSLDGADTLENLQPLHLSNDYDKSADQMRCQVTADRTGLQPGEQVGHPENQRI